MKKILFVFAAAAVTSLAACTAHNTAGDTKDSSASHGHSSGPQSSAADTINGSAAPFAESTSGTDTSTDGHGVDDPTIDTIYRQKKSK